MHGENEPSEGVVRFRRCPNCQSGSICPLSGFEEKNLFVCGGCHFIFDVRIPSAEVLDAHYANYAYSVRKNCPAPTRASYNRLLDKFEKYRKTNHILDVGCGQGDFLIEAKRRGWAVHGTEYSPAAVVLCEAAEISVSTGVLKAATFDPLKFDVVTSFEVFEHINNGFEEISTITEMLRGGGLFYLTTPNFNSVLRYLEGQEFRMIAYPEHISFYTSRSVASLGTSAGLEILKTETTGLDLGRLKAVLSCGSGAPRQLTSGSVRVQESNELRSRISGSYSLRAAKWLVNAALTITGTGDTLKAWMIKPDID